MATNKIRLEVKRLLATRGVGFQNSFPNGSRGGSEEVRQV